MRLEGKVAIITGAAMGIGAASARLFAREGAQVVVADFDAVNGRATADAVTGDGGEAVFVSCDVSNLSDVQAMVASALEAFGRIDVLFNNAGIDIPHSKSVVQTRIEDWDRTIDVNLKGVFYCSRCVIPEMIKRGGGVIINTASIAGLRPAPGEAAYTASKGGVVLLSREMAMDFAADNIRVVSICPGVMEKPTRDRLDLLKGDEKAFARRQSMGQKVPLGRLLAPEDIAYAALFLASDEASMITGTELVVDGGFSVPLF